MKKNILLLHGALGSVKQFDSLTPLLEDQFNVHVFDFDGHGLKAGMDSPFDMQRFAGNIKTYLTDNKITSTNILGYSMGGYAALLAACQAPQLFESIITLGTKFYWVTEYAERETAFLVPDIMIQKVPAFAAELESRHGHAWKNVVTRTAKMMLQLAEGPLLDNNALSQIDIPVTVGVGDRDKTVSVEETLAVSRTLKTGSLLVLPHTPHPFERVGMRVLKEIIYTRAT